MPELPEVETVIRQLREVLPGERFKEFRLYRKAVMPDVTSTNLRNILAGKVVERVFRRGKFIIIDAGEAPYLCIHLGMTGRLLWGTRSPCNPRHLRWKSEFQGGNCLLLDDIRCFSRIRLLPIEDSYLSKRLGPEPLGNGFDVDYLREILQSSRRTIKSLILDQNLVCGLGNIYANETLFAARIHPQRQGSDLGEEDISRLRASIVKTLEAAIGRSGTTISDFRDIYGRPGTNQNHLTVYGREGEPCPMCQTTIRRFSLGGRSSFFCPQCQR